MELDYATGQVLLRALRWHDRRMQEIGNSESQINQKEEARVAFDDARFAREMADKLERGGVRDLRYEDGQLLMRALRSYQTHITTHAENARLVGMHLAPREHEMENAAVNLLLAELELNGVRIK